MEHRFFKCGVKKAQRNPHPDPGEQMRQQRIPKNKHAIEVQLSFFSWALSRVFKRLLDTRSFSVWVAITINFRKMLADYLPTSPLRHADKPSNILIQHVDFWGYLFVLVVVVFFLGRLCFCSFVSFRNCVHFMFFITNLPHFFPRRFCVINFLKA